MPVIKAAKNSRILKRVEKKIGRELSNEKKKGKEEKRSKDEVRISAPMVRSMEPRNSEIGTTAYPSKVATSIKPYYSTTSLKGGAVRIKGLDMIAVVSTDTNVLGGTSLLLNGQRRQVEVSPLSTFFTSTKLGIDALRFEKYQFTKLKFIFMPDTGTGSDGSIILGYDPDVSDDFIEFITTAANSLGSMQTLLGFEDSESGSVWAPVVLDVKTIETDPTQILFTNYTGGDERLAFRGRLWVASGGSLPTNKVLGKLLIEYEIELYDPSVDQLNAQRKLTYSAPITYASGSDMISTMSTSAFLQDFSANGGKDAYPIIDANNIASNKSKAISIPPGKHKLFINNKCNSGGTPVFSATNPSVLPNISGQTANITSTTNDFSGAAPTALSSWEGIIEAGLGGAKLFLDQVFTGTTIQPVIQLIEWAASAIL